MKPSSGEVELLARLHGGLVTALISNSNAGQGWRPVCKGIYLGSKCFPSEKLALKAGERFILELQQQIKASQIRVRPKIEKLKRGAKIDGTAASE